MVSRMTRQTKPEEREDREEKQKQLPLPNECFATTETGLPLQQTTKSEDYKRGDRRLH